MKRYLYTCLWAGKNTTLNVHVKQKSDVMYFPNLHMNTKPYTDDVARPHTKAESSRNQPWLSSGTFLSLQSASRDCPERNVTKDRQGLLGSSALIHTSIPVYNIRLCVCVYMTAHKKTWDKLHSTPLSMVCKSWLGLKVFKFAEFSYQWICYTTDTKFAQFLNACFWEST